MVFGAIIQASKGISDNIKIKKQNEEVNLIIQKYSSRQKLIQEIDQLYDRTIVENQILFAEYLLKRSEYKNNPIKVQSLWEKVKLKMNDNIKKVEEQLNKESATKLDVAKLVTGLSQMSGEFDKELLIVKDVLSKEKAKNEESSNLVAKLKNFVLEEINEINKESMNLQRNIYDQLDSKTRNLENKFKEEIDSLRKEVFNNINELNENFIKETSSIQSNIQLQNELINSINSNIQNQLKKIEENNTKALEEQKKFTLKLIIPLYSISFILASVMFYLIIK
ncbi:hypothetical protein ACLM5H_19490 [Fredinandcohnia humi]